MISYALGIIINSKILFGITTHEFITRSYQVLFMRSCYNSDLTENHVGARVMLLRSFNSFEVWFTDLDWFSFE